MEINEANLMDLAAQLNNTLNPDYNVRRSAEKSLQQVEANEGYFRLLMLLMDRPGVPLEIRVAGAVTLKNFVKRNWRIIEGEPNVISELDRNAVKDHIVNLMLTTPDAVQRQLAETLSIIGLEDFPERWPNLSATLVEKMSSDDIRVVNSVLRTANSLFKRYRHEMKSDKLWLEIKYVLENFANPLTGLFIKTAQLAKIQAETAASSGGNAEIKIALKATYECLALISKIFYSLNVQDLPEFFEDHMNEWMPLFLQLLSTNVPCLRISDEDESDETSVVEELWTQICDNIALYAQKYDEEFSTYLQPFVGVVWQLLVTTGKQTRYDLLVCNAVQFLASVCEREQYKSLFENGDTLAQICEKVIIPNMEFRTSDEELFEDNPEEFIRKDIEGSDVDTRRRAAADFVKALCKHFEPTVIQIFSNYINHLFDQYVSNPKRMWAKKDAAVYLVVTLASKGQTARQGSTKISDLVNLTEFFQTYVVADLNDANVNELPVLKADALKYIVTFRSQLPRDLLLNAIPAIVRLFTAESVVVHTYAAHTLERLMTLKSPTGNNQPLFSGQDLLPHATDILTNIFGVFDKRGSAENEYVMKCLMRCLVVLSDAILPFSQALIARLSQKILLVSKNPSKPHFNHYLFECVCVLIKTVCKNDPVNGPPLFEETLFPPFEIVLKSDVVEFIPYVFQVLSLMLDARGVKTGVPEAYMSLFDQLLVPKLWETLGNVPALVKLVQAFIRVGPDQVLATQEKFLNPILGVFQKLISSNNTDHEGFYLLNTVIEYGKVDLLSTNMTAVFKLLFTRLASRKTTKFVKGAICFCCLFVIRFGARALIDAMDSVQHDIFKMFMEKIFLPDLQKVNGNIEKKICCVGITKLLVEAPDIMLKGKYSTFWPLLLQALIGLFELPEASSNEDDVFVDVEDIQGYTAAYSQLAFANRPELDPTGVGDSRIFLVKSLQKLDVAYGEETTLLMQKLDDRSLTYIRQYMSAAGSQLA